MPLAMQAKLLRVLEEGEVERVGGDKPVSVDVRVVVATHRDLEARVREEKFRQDLFHRIYVFPLLLPPLRERTGGHPRAGLAFCSASLRTEWMEAGSVFCGSYGGAANTLLAGKCPRVRNMVERLMLLATDVQVDRATVEMALPVGGAGTDCDLILVRSFVRARGCVLSGMSS